MVIFFVILKMVYCVYSLKSPRWGDSNEKKQYTFMLKENRKDTFIFPHDLALWLALSSSNYPCLEHVLIVPKLFEPLKFHCTPKYSIHDGSQVKATSMFEWYNYIYFVYICIIYVYVRLSVSVQKEIKAVYTEIGQRTYWYLRALGSLVNAWTCAKYVSRTKNHILSSLYNHEFHNSISYKYCTIRYSTLCYFSIWLNRNMT